MSLLVLSTIRKRLQAYDAKINWVVFCLVFGFTIGAWIDINGLWCELPIMVHELPEGWQLPSMLSATTQVAQIAPIVFLIGHALYPSAFTYTRVIYVILFIGALSCLLLAAFWKKTLFIFGQERSVGLILLNFSLAFLDGTSSVTFLPYIGSNFVKEYIIPNYIGESLAALVPSVISLMQGLGQTPPCHNVTTTDANNQSVTKLTPMDITPNFSVSLYFVFMFGLLCVSTISFTLLNFSRLAKRERKRLAIGGSNDSAASLHKTNVVGGGSAHASSDIVKNDSSNESSVPDYSPSTYDKSYLAKKEETDDLEVDASTNSIAPRVVDSASDTFEKYLLNTYIFIVSFTCYGVLPGLQSYSTLPYGNDIFNYAVNLSFVFLPIAIILSIWSYEVSIRQITIELAIAVGLAAYILYLSILSPCPPFLDSWLGPFLTVMAWILTQSMFMRVRCLVAARLERFGEKMLLVLGSLTMIGQIFGGLIIFIVVNIYELFASTPDCISIAEAQLLCKK